MRSSRAAVVLPAYGPTWAAPPGEPSLNKEQRRAPDAAGRIPHGIVEDTLVLAHGFDRNMLAGLIAPLDSGGLMSPAETPRCGHTTLSSAMPLYDSRHGSGGTE